MGWLLWVHHRRGGRGKETPLGRDDTRSAESNFGRDVDVAAPGVRITSTVPEAKGSYKRLSGTSMATPHVAGVAALVAEAHPDATAADLARRLTCMARRLPLASTDVGAGLVQAP